MKNSLIIRRYSTLFVFLIYISILNSSAQVVPNLDWVQNYSEKDQIENVPSAIDANNNVYITGYTVVSGSRDFTTIKYNSSGVQQWVKHYNNISLGDDRSNAVVVDVNGFIYVTGQSQGTGTGYDYATVKYDASGVQQWAVRYNGPGNGDDIAVALAVDNNGNVFVTGKSKGTSSLMDYTTVKYNSSGVQQWVTRYNGTANGDDNAVGIALGTGNRVFVTGTSKSLSNSNDIVTVRYNFNNGNQMWVSSLNGTAFGTDQAYGLIADGNDAVVYGSVENTSTQQDYAVAKLNGNNGNTVFQSSYNGYGSADIATSLAKDTQGDYVVTGTSRNVSTMEYHTIKYSSSGTQQWVNKRPINQAFTQVSPKVVTDFVDHIYICGELYNANGSDILIYQITPGGNTTWTETHNGAQNGVDVAVDLVMGNLGVIYLAGQTQNSNAKYDYTTIKYSQTPVYFPLDNINGEYVNSNYLFFQNKGQILDQSENLSDIEYYTMFCENQAFIKNDRLSYLFSQTGPIQNTMQRIDFKFKNSNSQSKIYPFESDIQQANYFLPHCNDGISVNGNKRLFIPNLYSNIDLHYYSNANGIKYYAIVKPGGNPNDFKIEIRGHNEDTLINNDSLIIKAFTGEINLKLELYQVNPSLNVIPVNGTPQLVESNNEFSITNFTYNPLFPLIIKFSMGEARSGERHQGPPDWSTPFGGTGVDYGMDVKTDEDGNTYWCGYSNSPFTTFPSDVGAVNTPAGDYDCIIYKIGSPQEPYLGMPNGFVPDGDKLLWTIFWGGSGDDRANALEVTGNMNGGSVFVTGNTQSADFNLGVGSSQYYNDSYSGNSDAHLISFQYDVIGILPLSTSATFIGGLNDDFANDIKYRNGKIAIGGITYSDPSTTSCSIPNTVGDNGFPICSTNFHSTNSGNGDGFILMVDNTQNLLVSEFIGGNGNEQVKSIFINNSDLIYFTGYTESDALTFDPIVLGGAYNQSYNGGLKDAFIGRNGLTPWLTFYGGAENDYGNGIAKKLTTNNFVVVGTTASDVPACSACYCTVPNPGEFPMCPNSLAYFQSDIGGFPIYGGGNTDGFIAEFNAANSLAWSTYRGGDKDDVINDVTFGGLVALGDLGNNIVENIIIAGETNSCDYLSLENDPGGDFFNSNISSFSDFAISSTAPCFINNNSIMSDGMLGLFTYIERRLLFTFRHSGDWPNYSNILYDDQVHTDFKAVATWGSHLFYNGYTTNELYLLRAGNGMDFDGNLGAWQNASVWPYNQNQTFNLNSIPADIAMMRYSMLPMAMVNISVEEFEDDFFPFTIFPNPTNEFINVKYDGNINEQFTISIFDVTGKLIYIINKKEFSNGNTERVSVSNLSSGIYCINITSEASVQSFKFIKQ